MSGRIMTHDDKITVKRQYRELIPEDKRFNEMSKRTKRYQTVERSKFCSRCPNIATQMFCSDVDGATFIEKYCGDCIKENKHIKQSELMENFDNLFSRKET